nr:hypothetical protein [uncultured Sphingomonas sp.]
MPDTDQKKEDEVLKRMLATKPKPHKDKAAEARKPRRPDGSKEA